MKDGKKYMKKAFKECLNSMKAIRQSIKDKKFSHSLIYTEDNSCAMYNKFIYKKARIRIVNIKDANYGKYMFEISIGLNSGSRLTFEIPESPEISHILTLRKIKPQYGSADFFRLSFNKYKNGKPISLSYANESFDYNLSVSETVMKSWDFLKTILGELKRRQILKGFKIRYYITKTENGETICFSWDPIDDRGVFLSYLQQF